MKYFRTSVWWTFIVININVSTVSSCSRPEIFPSEQLIYGLFSGCTFYIRFGDSENCADSHSELNHAYVLGSSDPKNGSAGIVPRFNQCTVQVHQLDLALTKDIPHLQDSDFGIIFLQQEWLRTRKETVENSLERLSNLQTSTMYFALVPEYGTLYTICLPCPKNLDLKLIPNSSKITVAGLASAWTFIHKDLHGQVILYPDRDVLQIRADCTQLYQYQFYKERCAPGALAQLFNFTLLFEPKAGFQPYTVLRNSLLHLIKDAGQYEWVPNGWIVEPYTFLIVLSKRANRQELLSQSPLGEITFYWQNVAISLLAAFVAGTWIFKAWAAHGIRVLRFRPLAWLTGLFQMFELVTAPLAEQGMSERLLYRNLTRSTVVRAILTLWALLTVVLNGAYKGALTSFLSKDMPNPTPDNLRDLVLGTQQFPIITNDVSQLSHQRESILEKIITGHTSAGQLTESELVLYKALANRAFFIPTDISPLVAAYQSHVNLGNETVPPSTEYYLPTNFAYMGFRSGVSRFYELIKPFSNVFVIRNAHQDNVVAVKIAMGMSKNYFGTRLFPSRFAWIHEAGLNAIWAQQRAQLYWFLDTKFINCVGARNRRGRTAQELYSGACRDLKNLLYTSTVRRMGARRKGITVDMLVNLGLFRYDLYAFCILVLGLEILVGLAEKLFAGFYPTRRVGWLRAEIATKKVSRLRFRKIVALHRSRTPTSMFERRLAGITLHYMK